MKKKILLSVLLLIVISIVGVAIWHFTRKTKIALVNFPAFQVSAMAKSVEADRIKVVGLGVSDLDQLSGCDAAVVFGMGIKLTPENREKLVEYGKKNPLATIMAIDPENDLSNIAQGSLDKIKMYFEKGGKQNYRSGLNYIRSEILGESVASDAIKDPQDIPDNVYFSEFDENVYNNKADYTKFLKSKGLYYPNGKVIALFAGNFGPFNSNKSQLDELIKALREAHWNVYPISSFTNRLSMLKEVDPDAVVYLPHGRFAMMGNSDEVVEYLKTKNIPFFAPLMIMNDYDAYLADKMGMSGGMLSQGITMPEIDGAIEPQVIIAQFKNKEGYEEFHCIPDRLARFISTVKKYLALHDKPNKDKRVAIYYYKGPGKASLVAAGMEVLPSLYNLLLRLKEEGYAVKELPSSEKAFEDFVMDKGSLPADYAKAKVASYLTSGIPYLMSEAEFQKALSSSFPQSNIDTLKSKYGEMSDNILSISQNGKNYIAVSRIQFGNVVLLPQPGMGGGGESDFRLVHGSNEVPPYHYLASYLWTKNKFNADAVIHFGTHGSLEFIPGKQVGLSKYDWPDGLISDIPHLYFYTIGDVGEAMIAKRRSYAQMVSHLTPGFMSTQLSSESNKITSLTSKYLETEKGDARLAQQIQSLAKQQGILRELNLDTTLRKPLTYEEVTLIDDYAQEIADAKITSGLYTLGVMMSPERINSSVTKMCVDPIAYSAADVAIVKKQASESQIRRSSYFSSHFAVPAERIVAQVLNSGRIDLDGALNQLGVSSEDLKRSQLILDDKKAAEGFAVMQMMSKKSKSAAKLDVKYGSEDGSTKKHMSYGQMMAAFMSGKKPPKDMMKRGRKQGHLSKSSNQSNQKSAQSMPKSMMSRPIKPAKMPSKADIRFANAVQKLKATIENILKYRSSLQQAPAVELGALVNALNGNYTPPSPGGDFVANPNTVPTGRNLFSVNAEATPSPKAIKMGEKMAEEMIKDYTRRNGSFPKKVSFTLWSGSFIESEGATIAEILYLLGVKPVTDMMGRVLDIELIPAKDLKRPRIDVVVQTSGQLRDLAASRLELIQKAVDLAANAPDKGENYVKDGVKSAERVLLDKGYSPKEARELSSQRIFGGLNGMAGTGIQGMVESGDKWDKENQIAQVYLNNMGASYGSQKGWGDFKKGLFEAALQNTDVVVQPRQSNTWGALSLDHVYEFMGGLTLTVRNVTGKDPEGYLNDLRNHYNAKAQELKTAIGIEAHTTLLNPAYVKEMLKEGAGSADAIAETIRNTYGWNVMKPKAIDKELWQGIYDMYIEDTQHLGTTKFFEEKNPTALQEITASMLETIRKGYWKASKSQIDKLSKMNANLTTKYDIQAEFTGENKKLQKFVQDHLSSSEKTQFSEKMSEQMGKVKDSKVLKKDQKDAEQVTTKDATKYVVPVAAVLLLLILLVVYVKRRNSHSKE